MKKHRGYSLIEILVVLSIFALLAIVSSQAILLTLRGTRKSESVAQVRDSLSSATSIIQRHLHNAREVVACDGVSITYLDQRGATASFSCNNIGEDGYIASGSAALTPQAISITQCMISCDPGQGGVPPSATIAFTAKDKNIEGVEGAQISTSTKVFLRAY